MKNIQYFKNEINDIIFDNDLQDDEVIPKILEAIKKWEEK